MMSPLMLSLLSGVLAIIYGAWSVRWILSQPQGNERMQEIAAAIQQGASAFLHEEYRVLGIFVIVVASVISTFLQWQTAICFVMGAIASGGAGYLGMYVAVRANVRTAAAADL